MAAPPKPLRLPLSLVLTVLGCDAGTLGTVQGCLPFPIPGLTLDAGAGQAVPLTGGPFDAAGFFEEPDAGFSAFMEGCGPQSPCGTALGLECVAVTTQAHACLQRCAAQGVCPNGQSCETVEGHPYCLPNVARGAPCEVGSCSADAGLRCLVARAEGSVVLAFTCQVPCNPDAPTCAAGEACMPGVAGELEAAGARLQHVCGTWAPLGDPALLGHAVAWDGGGCDPGTAARYCGGELDGGAPVRCAQGGAPAGVRDGGRTAFYPAGVQGVCVAVCQDPSVQPVMSHPCPTGWMCNTQIEAGLVHVEDEGRACTTSGECLRPLERCVGPLPAFENGFRCAQPYGLCSPL